MKDVGAEYEDLLKLHLSQGPKLGMADFISSVTGFKLEPEERLDANYWRRNLESPVLFKTASTTLFDKTLSINTVVEIGPHPQLLGSLRQTSKQEDANKSVIFTPTLVRDNDCVISILGTVGQLHSAGHSVKLDYINPSGKFLSDLPLYPWDLSKEYWHESRFSKGWRLRKYPHHELLGSKDPHSRDDEPIWRNKLHVSDVSWLGDHRVEGTAILPCTGFVAIMGEVMRQMTEKTSYEIKNLMIKGALVLPEFDSLEIVTVVRPVKVTELSNSKKWHEISIRTFNGSTWMEHCCGQATGLDTEPKDCDDPIVPLKRHVDEKYLYQRLTTVGIHHGPLLQVMENISTDTEKPMAVSNFHNPKFEDAPFYSIHPGVLDGCMQLCVVAGCKGVVRDINILLLPLDIRSFIVHPTSSPKLAARAILGLHHAGGQIRVTDDTGRLVVSIEGAKAVPVDSSKMPNPIESWNLARLEFQPLIDYCSPDTFISRADASVENRNLFTEIVSVAMIQTSKIMESLKLELTGHLSKYANWLNEQMKFISSGGVDRYAPQAKQRLDMSVEETTLILEEYVAKFAATGDKDCLGMARLFRDMAQRDVIEATFRDGEDVFDSQADLENWASMFRLAQEAVDLSRFLRLAGHAKPTMKILEIGAGTGVTTEHALRRLVTADGVRTFSKYVFSDLSPGFFLSAKERFSEYSGLEYKVLNIEKDPAEQGFEKGSFDLIIAANVIHATSSLHNSLKNIRWLLRDGGRIYIQEIATPAAFGIPAFVTGRFEGWWLGEKDNRKDGPQAPPERWDQELRDAGFMGVQSLLIDDDDPRMHMCSHMISTAQSTKINPGTNDIVIIYKDQLHEYGEKLAQDLEGRGHKVYRRRLDLDDHGDFSHVKSVVSTIDLEGPFFHDISEKDWSTWTQYLSTLKHGILWLTRSVQMHCTDPRYGMVTGIARTLRLELFLDFYTVELHELDDISRKASSLLCDRFFNREALQSGVDTEFLVYQGQIHVGRFHWKGLAKEAARVAANSFKGRCKQLVVGQYGLIDSLKMVTQDIPPLGDEDVEIDVKYVGLNFRVSSVPRLFHVATC